MQRSVLSFLGLGILTLISSTALGQPTAEYITNAGVLELRTQPDWDSPTNGKLMRGEPVKVLSHTEIWAKVQYKAQEMYVPFALLSESSPWVPESKSLASSRVAAHFRKKRHRSSKEIRDTLSNVQKKGSLKDESEFIDDPELITQLGGTPIEPNTEIENPMDTTQQEPPADGARPPELEKGNLLPSEGSADLASRDPAKVRPQAPQSFGPAVKKVEAMKFDLKSIRRMDKYKLTDKDVRRFRAQGKLSSGD